MHTDSQSAFPAGSSKPSSLRAKFENMAKQGEEEARKKAEEERQRRKAREQAEKEAAKKQEEERLKILRQKDEEVCDLRETSVLLILSKLLKIFFLKIVVKIFPCLSILGCCQIVSCETTTFTSTKYSAGIYLLYIFPSRAPVLPPYLHQAHS